MSKPEEPPYTIGYGCPPKHTQFKPGTSGNPKGGSKKRSPEAETLEEKVLELLEEKVSISVNGKRRRIPRIDIILTQTMNNSMKDTGAAKEIIKLYEI